MKELLQQWVTQHAERRPDATALAMRKKQLTYGQLEERTNQLAGMLKAAGCRKADRVGLLMPKSVEAIIGIVGTLKADCVYVPLDVSSPAPRLAQIITSSEPRCILAARPAAVLVDQLWADEKFRTTIAVGWMESDRVVGKHFTPAFSQADWETYPAKPLDYQNDREGPAYILYTSGSTGTPKGVVITHSNVIHFVEWAAQHFGMSASDRISGHSPLHFDLSVFDVFGTFAAGAQLHLVPPELNLLPKHLADFIRTAELTQWFSVPSVLTYMARFDVVRFNDFPILKRLLWCGEVLPTPILAHWMQRLPHVTFTNLYGPTEATVASSYYTVPRCPEDQTAATPIGTGCDGEELLVLDDRLQPVQSGEIGDLYIRGVGLSPGYWRDPAKTCAAFVPDPHSTDSSDRIYRTGDLATVGDDGLVYFRGRADSQIKSRGYRIELGEIETWLHAMASVKESAVVAIDTDGFEGATICCAYVPASTTDVTPVTLRQALSRVLPPYMVPSRWIALAALPRNANGKIDRPQLREHFRTLPFRLEEI